ncbi:elongator complex protein 6 [Hordeum vulgare]|nr:elongator complex protein 6 [Hordeum vulgare]
MQGYGGEDLLGEAMCAGARVVVVEDCVEAPAAFVLHLLLKRALAAGGGAALLALAHPFSHYDRVLRKMGCNLSVHRKSERLHFFDLQASLICMLLYSGGTRGGVIADSLAQLYSGLQRVVEAYRTGENAGRFTVMIDDVSLLEVAANGSADDVLDFLHYCVTLTSEMNCSLVVLNHEDIYSSEDGVGLLLHLRYIADLVIKAAPLSTGLAADVHGQVRFSITTLHTLGSCFDFWSQYSAVSGKQGNAHRAKTSERAESLELPFQGEGKRRRLLLPREQTLEPQANFGHSKADLSEVALF